MLLFARSEVRRNFGKTTQFGVSDSVDAVVHLHQMIKSVELPGHCTNGYLARVYRIMYDIISRKKHFQAGNWKGLWTLIMSEAL